MDWLRSRIARITGTPLYRKRVHQLRAIGWMLACAVGQLLQTKSLDELLTWDRHRWLLGIGAIVVPALLLSMRGGEFNEPMQLQQQAAAQDGSQK